MQIRFNFIKLHYISFTIINIIIIIIAICPKTQNQLEKEEIKDKGEIEILYSE